MMAAPSWTSHRLPGRSVRVGMSGPGILRVPLGSIAAGVIALPPEAASYVVRVHRLREGDRFVVFDPELGVEADATLESVGRRSAEARIDAPRPAALQGSPSHQQRPPGGRYDESHEIFRH